MSWFTTEGKHPHHVIFSKTTFVRNLSGMPFTKKMGDKSIDSFFKKADALLSKNGFRSDILSESDPIYPLSLAEKGFIDNGMLTSSPRRAVYFNEPCSLSVSLGGRDLISISSLVSGLAMTETRNIAISAEELLDREFEFAYNEQTGYLSATPSLCGSGAMFSAMLFLPALVSQGEISDLRRSCAELGASLEPAFIHRGGNLYFISHTPSHLCNETHAAEGFSALIEAIIDRETTLEGIIAEGNGRIIVDRAWRAYGQMLYARLLDESDLLTLSSALRFSLAATEGKAKLPPVTVKELNLILGECLNASITATSGCNSDEEIATSRAEIVSKMIYTATGG